MRKTRNATLNLLSLESKITPTVTAKLSGGNLQIFGDATSNTVYINSHAANVVDVYAVPGHVTDAGNNPQFTNNTIAPNLVGTFVLGASGNITAYMGKSDDYVVLTQDDGTALPGMFTANLAQGADDVVIQTRNNGPATIPGKVTLFGGDGADNFFIFDTVIDQRTTANGGSSGFRVQHDPSLITLGNPTGAYNAYGDVFQFSHCTFNSDVVSSNCATLVDQGYGHNQINGNLRVTDSTPSPLGNYHPLSGLNYAAGSTPGSPGTYSGLLVIDADCTVAGDLFYVGSSSNDGVYINGTVTGRASISVAAGSNDLFLGDRGGKATMGGKVDYIGNKGVDRITIADFTTIAGNLTMSVGDGVNVYDLNHAWSVSGDLRITAGKDNDVVGTLGGSVGGNVIVNLGNGNNSVVFASADVGNDGDLSYTGGSGTDSVQMNGSHHKFTGNFGSGNDTFSYGALASLSLSITANGGAGTDVFNKNGVTETWKVSRTAFEIVNP